MQKLLAASLLVVASIAPVGIAFTAEEKPAEKPAAEKAAASKPVTASAVPQKAADVDWAKTQELFRRSNSGAKLSDADQAYLDAAKKFRSERNRTTGKPTRTARRARDAGALTPKDHWGLTPLPELTDSYKGETGGLYGDGRNEPPAAHLAAALSAAKQIQPLDERGKPAADGKIVLLSLGMSNTTQEFSQFIKLANDDAGRNPQVVIVDGAQGGQDARDWAEKLTTRGGKTSPWDNVDLRLARARVTASQVQVVWLKQALKSPGSLGE